MDARHLTDRTPAHPDRQLRGWRRTITPEVVAWEAWRPGRSGAVCRVEVSLPAATLGSARQAARVVRYLRECLRRACAVS